MASVLECEKRLIMSFLNIRNFLILFLVFNVSLIYGLHSIKAEDDPLNRFALRVEAEKAVRSVLLGADLAGERLVAVGERGIIILSDDYGINWRQAKEVPVSVTLTAVCFPTSQKGWVLGHAGVVLHSQDGGETWQKQLDGIKAARLAIEDAQARLKAGDANTITLQQKLQSARFLVDDGPDKPFFDLYFENEKCGYIVGAYNLIYRTEDGGKNWLPWQSYVDNPNDLHLYSIKKLGSDFYIAGEQGLFLHTENGGDVFTVLSTPYEGSFFGLLAFGKSSILLFGLRGHVFLSEDSGKNWKEIDTGCRFSFNWGKVLNNGALVLVSQAGTVFVSHDNGYNFKEVSFGKKASFCDVVQATDRNLILVGLNGISRIINHTALSPTN